MSKESIKGTLKQFAEPVTKIVQQVAGKFSEFLKGQNKMVALTIIILIVATMLLTLVFCCRAAHKDCTIGLAGMPCSGKTQLYQYLMNRQVPETVKSSKITTFTGHLDGNPDQLLTLIDIPSDQVIQNTFDFSQLTKLVFTATEANKDTAVKLVQILIKLNHKCEVFITVGDKKYLSDIEKEYARINGVDEAEIPFDIQIVKFDLKDISAMEKFEDQILK
ncbi:Signal_recognition particle receptor beta subunit [Hexamita inflata]|uniref:Signal recognition particle receptor beta subunit n=1 Tax=Hexamita inflata TaxID=28002 RepID=A0AA86TKB6_9EUKA|nr:Signal recognition particle receptor beta subunit [Hexamita inflata]CAI9925511.1 Signal recognition particle receptor beta subunit [Hexamita inflata]CAI9967525.1 Signal recognition particle receptor beta subunit [Hexamita inflata]